MAQKSIYLPDDVETKEILDRVEILEKNYKVSFSEIVVSALREFVKVKEPLIKRPAKADDIRTASMVGIK